MWYRFDVDALAARDGKLLITRGGRHFLLGGLPPADSLRLASAYERADFVAADQLAGATRSALLGGQFLVEADPATLDDYQAAQRKSRPRLAFRLAHPLRALGSMPGLMAMLALTLALYLLGQRHMQFTSIAGLAATASAGQALLAIATLLASTAIHELGHAAAACFYTGTVGKARLRLLWGVPAVTIDVTSFCLTGRTGKVAISLAGAVFQLFASVCLLGASELPGIQAGASMGIFLALFNLLPLPHYDGYWIVVDLIGRRLRPRLRATRDWLEVGYGLCLLGLFARAVPAGAHGIAAQASAGAAMLGAAPLRGAILVALSLVAAVSFCVFGVTLFKTLFAPAATS